MEKTYHIPAMLHETIEGLAIRPNGVYVDVTLGGGGHSRAILKELGENGRLYSMDQDLDAIANASPSTRWRPIHGNFRYIANFMDYYGENEIDGILADLGVSFHHFDEAERGFSFRFDAPLDMRMNQQGGQTAADIVNTYKEEDLTRLLTLYGEVKNAKALVKKIVAARPISSTWDLVRCLVGENSIVPKTEHGEATIDVDPRKKKELTCVFQALRIEVNDELGALREMLVASKELLKKGGRIVVLTYHSLEDRIVKNFLRSGNLEGEIEKDFFGNILTPFKVLEKGLSASEEEVARNPRSRSAKLRIAEKI